MDISIPFSVIMYAGLLCSAACFIMLAWKYAPKLTGLFKGVSIPSLSSDPRVCMMQDWDCLKAQLRAVGVTDEELKPTHDLIWGNIQKIEVPE